MKAGVAISPATPSTAITDAIAEKADMLLVMTVVPGKGGQKFMAECVPKVRRAAISPNATKSLNKLTH
jgi:ribulose-phosphate 3-epimerase